jgi:hypothetical protein
VGEAVASVLQSFPLHGSHLVRTDNKYFYSDDKILLLGIYMRVGLTDDALGVFLLLHVPFHGVPDGW